jgi:hypothetical protein
LEDTREEVRGRNRPFPSLPAEDQLRVESEHHRRYVGGRIPVRQRPTDCPPMADLRIPDRPGSERDDRAVLLQEWIAVHVVMPGQRPDRYVLPAVPDIRQLRESADVDEYGWPGEAQLHRGKEGVPAGDQLCVLPLAEERERVLGALRDFVVERRGNHRFTS